MSLLAIIAASVAGAVIFAALGRAIGTHIAKKQQRLLDMRRNGSKHV